MVNHVHQGMFSDDHTHGRMEENKHVWNSWQSMLRVSSVMRGNPSLFFDVFPSLFFDIFAECKTQTSHEKGMPFD